MCEWVPGQLLGGCLSGASISVCLTKCCILVSVGY